MEKALIIVSRYNEDVSWLKKYDNPHLIYNKGEPLEGDYNVEETENIGNNQRDIFKFFVDNYDNLPDRMVFVQAYPFDHCKEERFKEMIERDWFTPLETLEHLPDTHVNRKGADGGYMEINNSWYIAAHNSTHNQTCKYPSYDVFMHTILKNYTHVDWIRFTPGSQYLIPKEMVTRFSKKFWEHMMNELPKNNMTEGHIIERSIYLILTGVYEVVEELK